MLIIWNHVLLPQDQEELYQLDSHVNFWPRSWTHMEIELNIDPKSWWISFSQKGSGLIWIIRRPEHSLVIYKN